MKVLLFTHSQDIDGIGCIVLAKEAFSSEKLTYVPCKTFEITSKVNELYQGKKLLEYDLIFVTDLCIKEPLLSLIDNDKNIRSKFRVLDHHKTEIDEGNNKYSFVDIIVEQNGIKECGTSLFYKYLIQNNFIKPSLFLNNFTEFTRQYDVWDWKKNNNEKARELNIIFEELGIEKYLSIIENMKKYNMVYFDEYCRKIIDSYNTSLYKELSKVFSTLKVTEIYIQNKKINIGFVDTLYKLRNEIPDFIKMKNVSVDVIGMNILDGETISYRNINKDIDCAKIAEQFGGKGHKDAGSNPKENEKFKEFWKSKFNSDISKNA